MAGIGPISPGPGVEYVAQGVTDSTGGIIGTDVVGYCVQDSNDQDVVDVYDVKDTLVGEIEFGGTSGLTLYNSSGAVITEPNGPAATNVLTYRGFTAAEIDTAVENEAGTTTRTSLSDATEEGVEVALGRFLIQSYEAQQQTVALTDVYSAMGQYAGSFGVDDVNGVIASWGDGEEEDLTTVADQRGRFRFGPVNDNSTTDGVLAEHISRHELL